MSEWARSSVLVRWAVQWRSLNRLNGLDEHLMWNAAGPYLFRTRDAARTWVEGEYGYIRTRPDLRTEPYGWMMPRPLKVEVRLVPVSDRPPVEP